jgi:4-diphosphocytidyl-2-C-methyl-D-erythritol kinase
MCMKPNSSPSQTADTIRADAPAKINLTLAVLGKRPDGFHEIESLVVPIGLCDEVELTSSEGPEIRLECDDPGLPDGPENLAVRAAQALARAAGRKDGLLIRLRKRIPVGAGLGGGSSDAAAVLRGLNDLWRLGMGRQELGGLAAGLGSDVPLFLDRGAVIIRGRGEAVEAVDLNWGGWAVLISPPFGLATADVYRAWRTDVVPPRTAGDVVSAARNGERFDRLLYNMLEAPAFRVEPRLAELHAGIQRLGAPYARMSGSGSSLFALFPEAARAESFAAEAKRRLGLRAWVVRTTNATAPVRSGDDNHGHHRSSRQADGGPD